MRLKKKDKIFTKSHITRVLGANKVKSDIWANSPMEYCLKKNSFCSSWLIKKELFREKKYPFLAEKTIFLFFSYSNFKVNIRKFMSSLGLWPTEFFFHFWILFTQINNSTGTILLIRPLFEKNFALIKAEITQNLELLL